jgi:hypothetical protein
MKSYKYRQLVWEFISAADSGKYDSLSIEEVRRHADAETIPAFIVDRFGDDFDLSTFDADDWTEIARTWASISNAVDARRKFGVENKGICLLMAFALESMQMLHRKEHPNSI